VTKNWSRTKRLAHGGFHIYTKTLAPDCLQFITERTEPPVEQRPPVQPRATDDQRIYPRTYPLNIRGYMPGSSRGYIRGYICDISADISVDISLPSSSSSSSSSSWMALCISCYSDAIFSATMRVATARVDQRATRFEHALWCMVCSVAEPG